MVSRDTEWVDITYDAIMGIYIIAEDIKNAYLTAASSDKFYIICSM